MFELIGKILLTGVLALIMIIFLDGLRYRLKDMWRNFTWERRDNSTLMNYVAVGFLLLFISMIGLMIAYIWLA